MTGLEKLKSFNHMYRQERGSIGTNYIDAVDDLIFEVERLRQRVAEQDKVVESEGVDRSAVSQRQANDVRLKDAAIRRKNQRIRELVQKATEKNILIAELIGVLEEIRAYDVDWSRDLNSQIHELQFLAEKPVKTAVQKALEKAGVK